MPDVDLRLPAIKAGAYCISSAMRGPTACWDRTWFGFVTPLTTIGLERQLTMDDCFSIPPELSAATTTTRLLDAWNNAADDQSLLRVFLRHHAVKLRRLGFLTILNAAGEISRPCLVYALLKVLEEDDDSDLYIGLALCCALLFTSILANFALTTYFYYAQAEFGTEILGSLHGVVFRKTLTAQSAMCDKSEVNLVSADAMMIVDAVLWGMRLIGFGAMTIASVGMLLWLLSWAAACAVLPLFVLVALQSCIGKKQGGLQRQKQAHADARIQQVLEAVTGVAVLKQQVWEANMMNEIDKHRTPELLRLKAIRLLFCTNEVLAGATVFTSLAICNILRQPLTFIPIIADTIVKAAVSFERIESFLLQPDLKLICTHAATARDTGSSLHNALDSKKKTHEAHPLAVSTPGSIFLEGRFRWSEDEAAFQLNCPALSVSAGQIVGVVGRVGAGKSSLLRAMLGELPVELESNHTQLSGKIAYAPQVAWIQKGSVRDGILFGSPMEQPWYDQVVEACALTQDFNLMPFGDLTEIGERGISLSGGQQARLNIARCVYSRPDIALLDDPLAALDQTVAAYVFQKALVELMDCSVVLVLNQLHLLEQCDTVAFVGTVSMGTVEVGTLKHLTGNCPEFCRALNEYGVTANSSTEKEEVPLTETASAAEQEWSTEKEEVPLTETASAETDPLLGSTPGPKSADEQQDPNSEGRVTGSISRETWCEMIRSCGGTLFVCNSASGLIATGVALAVSDFILADWVDDLKDNPDTSSTGPLIALGVSVVLITLCTLWRSLTFALGFIRAARTINEDAMRSVLFAPMRFFHTNPSGRIVNRFSGDLMAIEQQLPIFFEHTMICLMMVCFTIITIAVLLPYFLIAIAPIAVAFYFVCQRFLGTYRDLKRLHAISKSPCLQMLGEVVDGRSAVRAFQREEFVTDTFYQSCDILSKTWYTMASCQWWQYARISLIGAFAVFSAAVCTVLLRNSLSAGMQGLILNFALLHTFYLTGLVILACEAEGTMAASERLLEFTKLSPEALDTAVENSVCAPEHWPTTGLIEFKMLKARYAPQLPPALSIDSLVIYPGESVGVCGRTGSGKTTMVNCLFRMLPIDVGSIFIDGVDIATIQLQEMRSRLSIIPQKPMIFKGPLRSNIDPFNELSDQQVLDAMTQARLHTLQDAINCKTDEIELQDSSTAALLDHEVGASGDSLSVGTRQLVCVARALAKKSRVVLCDEATASLDQETDLLVMRAIHTHFKHATCIIVAHRLHTIIACDKCIVADKGRIAQYDSPHNLLTRHRGGVFDTLVDSCGAETSQALRTAAATSAIFNQIRANITAHN